MNQWASFPDSERFYRIRQILLSHSILLAFLCLFVCQNADGQMSTGPVENGLNLKEIFHEPFLPGVRPELITFTADMKGILFSWNDSSYSEPGTYRIDLDGDSTEKAPEGTVEDFRISPDHSEVAYIREDRAIMLADTGFHQQRVLVEAEADISHLTWSPDGAHIAYMKGNEIWIAGTETTYIKQVTSHENGSVSLEPEQWAGNRAMLLRSSDSSDADPIYFPDYLGEQVMPGSVIREIPETVFAVADLETGQIDTLVHDVNRSMTDVSHSGRYIVIDYADAALKKREIRVYDRNSGTMNVVFSDSTSGWLYGTMIEFNPSKDVLMFQSERDNWNHIYTVNADGTGLRQHTAGEFDIPWAAWLDSSVFVFASTEEDPGERHIYTQNYEDGTRKKLTVEPAYRYRFDLSPDRQRVVYAKTDWNRPYDLYKLGIDECSSFDGHGIDGLSNEERSRIDEADLDEREFKEHNSEGHKTETRITNTVPDRFHEFPWQQEEYIRFTARDGETELSMSVLYPQNFDNSKEHPVIVFFHGAGSLQNVYRGWSENYYREYMFNQFLTQHGYLVVEVDFRHSTGYGRKFREDVTNWLGKHEIQDALDGLNWLQKNVGGLDMERVGSYGGSYGGFLSLYAASVEPERFHAAAALRAVTNWRNYYASNPWYTLPRLGNPEEHPEHYERSSPLSFASEMKHPVLILHGLKDDNVGFRNAAQYIEALISSGHEDFEMMMYPTERHSFVSPDSWYDQYRRIFLFFEEHVRSRDN